MVELSDIPEAVLWHEGMLLAPQHFQQASRRSEALSGYVLQATGQFPWGVRRLSIDRALLAGGRLRILDLEAVLPDGLAVLHPWPGDSVLELDLAAVKDDLAAAPMAVHLTVPAETQAPAPSDLRRWRSVEGRPVADVNTGDGEVSVPRLRPVLSLTLTSSPTVPPPARYVALPIAVVSFRDDAFTLEPFSPPRLDMADGTELADLVRRVAQRMREKASALAERLQAPSMDGGELPGGALLDALRSLVGPLPRLEGLLQAQRVHPFQVYLVLCDLMGSLSWMGGQPVPPPPPSYRHEDPLSAFQELAAYVLRMIERVRESFRAVRMSRAAEDRFVVMLDPELLTGTSLVLGLRIAPGATPGQTAEWMSKALIGSRSVLRSIGERRIRGASRQRIERADELGLVPPASMVLFVVSAEAEFVLAGEVLEVLGTGGGGTPPADIQLFVAAAAPVRAAPAKKSAVRTAPSQTPLVKPPRQ